jgi:type II secretory pathway component PulF
VEREFRLNSFEQDAQSLHYAQSSDPQLLKLKLQLSIELAPPNWRRALRRFSQQLQAGLSWNESIARSKPGRELRSHLRAAAVCADPMDTLTELLRCTGRSTSLASAIQPLWYPVCMLIGTFAVTSAFAWVGSHSMVGIEWYSWISGKQTNGISQLFQTNWDRSVATAIMFAWLLLIAVVIRLLASTLTRLSLALQLPFVGKLVAWSMFRDLFSRYEVFLRSGISDLQAAQALVTLCEGQLLAIPASGLQQRIASGQMMDQAVRGSMLCDEFLWPAAEIFRPEHSPSQSQGGTLQNIQGLVQLANQLFEQRSDSLCRVANRVAILLILCMYCRLGIDISIVVASGLSLLRPIGSSINSMNWSVLFPIGVVNFVFCAALFPARRIGKPTRVASLIQLFAWTLLGVSIVGISSRLNVTDFIYAVPVCMALVALRTNGNVCKRSAANQALILSGSDVDLRKAIAKRLIQVHRGQVRRRSHRFLELTNLDVGFNEAARRSKLVREPHERWLIGLIVRFGEMQETRKILGCNSPWFECTQRLSERANAFKWMAALFVVSSGYLVSLQLFAIFPMMRRMLSEFGIDDSHAGELGRSSLVGSNGAVDFLLMEIRDPLTSWYGVPLLCLFVSPILFVFLLQTCRPFHTMIVAWWMRPIYRAWTLRGISEAMATERNIVTLLQSCSDIHPVSAIRKQLSRLVTGIESGMSVPKSMVQSRLIRGSQQSLVALAKEPQQLAWTLGQIAERNFHRWIGWYALLLDLLSVAIILSMAFMVGYLACIVFKVLTAVVMFTPFA